ncbi:DUF5677 domain-containing protein [Lelliottia amnigena]
MFSLERFFKWVELEGQNVEDVSEEDIQSLYVKYIDTQAKNSLNIYIATLPDIIKKNHLQHEKFKENNINHWKNALDHLELLIHLSIKSGSDISISREQNTNIANEIHECLLIRLHARACSIANEVLFLLKNGFADAAQARWRSLHEINVTLRFIQNFGPDCSERFLAHDIVDSYEAMRAHRKFEHRLQEKGPTDEEYAAIDKLYKNALKQYGNDFKDQYGWATPFLPTSSGRVGFQRIEKAVELDHMRPYFKWASQNIHTSSKTLMKRLSLPNFEKELINVGPSNFGLTDPAHSTAISLMQATTWLLSNDLNEDNAITINMLKSLSKIIGDKFFAISKAFES